MFTDIRLNIKLVYDECVVVHANSLELNKRRDCVNTVVVSVMSVGHRTVRSPSYLPAGCGKINMISIRIRASEDGGFDQYLKEWDGLVIPTLNDD